MFSLTMWLEAIKNSAQRRRWLQTPQAKHCKIKRNKEKYNINKSHKTDHGEKSEMNDQRKKQKGIFGQKVPWITKPGANP